MKTLKFITIITLMIYNIDYIKIKKIINLDFLIILKLKKQSILIF